MKRLILLLLVFGFCCRGGEVPWDNIQRYYDDREVEAVVDLDSEISATGLLWQLVTPYGRVMAQGQAFRYPKAAFVKIPLRLDKLEDGISLKCFLQVKLDGKVVGKQEMIIYSREIFTDIVGKLSSRGAGAILPVEQIAKLNKLGMRLPVKPLDNFENPENKLIFCSTDKYCDNVYMLKTLLSQGKTLVMFASAGGNEIYLPQEDLGEFILISAQKSKTSGSLGVICNNAKMAVRFTGGAGVLVAFKYRQGKIIIIAGSVLAELDKKPDAALILKKVLTQK